MCVFICVCYGFRVRICTSVLLSLSHTCHSNNLPRVVYSTCTMYRAYPLPHFSSVRNLLHFKGPESKYLSSSFDYA